MILQIGTEHKLCVALKHVPNWLPVHACRFHRNVRDRVFNQPVKQGQKSRSRRRKGPNLLRKRVIGESNAGHHVILMHVEARTTRVKYFHVISSE
jgi:hypothetical protein